jgi:K+:H+ antiporter
MGFWAILLEVVILLAAGLLLGLAAQRVKTNPVIGYLLTGLILGPGVLNQVRDVASVRLLAELGVALLLFTIGLEFSWPRLKQFGRLATLGGLLQIGLTAATGFGLARWLGLPASGAVVVGAALALSSTAVVLRVLSDRAELDSLHGRAILGVLLMQDVALVPLLMLVSVLSEGKSGFAGIQDLGIALAKAGALVAILYAVARWVFPRLFQAAFSQRERDFPIVLATSVCGGCTWAANSVGLSPALGAFTAGILLAGLRHAEQARADILPLRSIFSLLFFVSIGMLGSIPSGRELATAIEWTLVIVGVKALVVMGVFSLLRQPAGVSVRAGMSLAQIGEFSFVLAQDAFLKGLLPIQIFQPLLTSSLFTLLLSPYLIQLAPRLVHGMEKILHRRLGETAAGGVGGGARDRVVVVGYGPAGRQVCARLRTESIPYLVLEMNAQTVAANERVFSIRLGDATNPEILLHAGVSEARAVAITLPDPAIAAAVIRNVRLLAPSVPVVARGRYHLHASKLKAAGAEAVVDEEELLGDELARRLLEEPEAPSR